MQEIVEIAHCAVRSFVFTFGRTSVLLLVQKETKQRKAHPQLASLAIDNWQLTMNNFGFASVWSREQRFALREVNS